MMISVSICSLQPKTINRKMTIILNHPDQYMKNDEFYKSTNHSKIR